MLATSSAPFDSAEHLFEMKWDGVRALAKVEGRQWRLWGRECSDYTDRYPELTVLRRLPSGTVVDGELVVLNQGRAELNALLRRHQLVDPGRIRHARRHLPVRYVLFDILSHRGHSLLTEPLHRRRAILTDLLLSVNEPELTFSEGVVFRGKALFERVVAQGHEGVMAKHLASLYGPGKRSPAWQKIKPAPTTHGHLRDAVFRGLLEGNP
jgi:ATP-dependent DNA ligase